MTTPPDPLTARAAALFYAAAITNQPLEAGARLRCLSAATRLTIPDLTEAEPGDENANEPAPADLIRAALTALAGLPAERFLDPQVADAAADGRRALHQLG